MVVTDLESEVTVLMYFMLLKITIVWHHKSSLGKRRALAKLVEP